MHLKAVLILGACSNMNITKVYRDKLSGKVTKGLFNLLFTLFSASGVLSESNLLSPNLISHQDHWHGTL